jgi:hypothetical protein
MRVVRQIRRLVFVVAPEQRELYESLVRTFKEDRSVQIVIDRRRGERRQREAPATSDRRRADRRVEADVQKKLASRGYAVVGVIAAKTSARS